MLRLAATLALFVIRLVYCAENNVPREPLAEDAAHIGPRQQFSNGKQAMDSLHAMYTANTRAALSSNGGACTAENIVVRKEW